MATPPSPRQSRNRQGEGGKLRFTILDAASRILETTGSDEALTLRAVAREAGITAPAIYAHFADRDELRATVVAITFAQLAETLRATYDEHGQPVQRLRRLCTAYLDFAADRPRHYRVLFERQREASRPVTPAHDVHTMIGADAFKVLLDAVVACVEAGASDAATPSIAATRVWIGLHGQATLSASLPGFPWPDRATLANDIMLRLADIGPEVARGQ